MIICTHGDADGICAAALVLSCKSISKNAPRIYFSHPIGLSHDLAQFDEDIIILDIAIDLKHWSFTKRELERLSEVHKVLYVDHHELPEPLPEKVEYYGEENISTTELCFRYFYKEIHESNEIIAAIGAICDYFIDSPLMEEIMIQFEKRALFLEAGLLAQGLYPISHNYNLKRQLILKFAEGTYPSEIDFLTKGAIEYSISEKYERERVLKEYKTLNNIAYIENPKSSRSKAAHWVMGHTRLAIGIAITSHYVKNDKVDLVIRGRDLFDLRRVIPNLAIKHGGTGGGHKNACGARIPQENLKAFLQELDDYIGDLL
jgi:single-stranded-DNA-specific exonuclease